MVSGLHNRATILDKHLRSTLNFVRNWSLWEKFNFYFPVFFLLWVEIALKVLELQKLLKKNLVWRHLKWVRSKTLFSVTITTKITGTSSGFHVQLRTIGKVKFLFFSTFLLVLTKFLFSEEDWVLCYNFVKSWDFPDISLFFKFLILSCSAILWGDLYISF